MNKEIRLPQYGNVILINDERVSFDFAMQLLRHVFGRGELEAREIVTSAGWLGKYSCGTFPYAVAEAFVAEARRYAEAEGKTVHIELEPLVVNPEAQPRCSFCGRSSTDVRKLVPGKSAFICDACVLNGARSLAASAQHEQFNFVYELLEWHFEGLPNDRIAASNRSFPDRVRADLQRAAEEIFAPGALKTVALHGGYDYEQTTITTLLRRDRNAKTIGPLRYHDVDIGEEEPVACLENALWLRREGDLPVAILLVRQREMRGSATLNVEIAAPAGDAGRQVIEAFFRALEQSIHQSSSYRGKVLSLEQTDMYSGMAAGILVHRLPPVAREEVILPEQTLDLLERNIISFAKLREPLRTLKQSSKKGLLFYGPPGTGKTHTVRYLACTLPRHTTLLITAEQVAILPDYFTLARLLQPSIMVIEDADLIARERTTMDSPCEEVLLNKLLNEMDGLRQDAEIFFILTTNRPEMLEPALASRPGRIDQAIEFPLPDDTGRRKLIELYGRGMKIGPSLVDDIVHKTVGVSAAFIKELMRRTAQYNLEAGGSGAVTDADCAAAMEEMLFTGGRLNRSLLGSKDAVS